MLLQSCVESVVVSSVVVLLVATHDVHGKCFSLLGFSTCQDAAINSKYPFSVPWFFANLEPRVSSVSDIVINLDKSPLGSVMGKLPDYDKVIEAIETRILQRLLAESLQHLQARGDEPSLLYDKEVDPYDLYNCFEAHSKEIYAYLDQLVEEDVLSPDVKHFTMSSKDVLGKIVTLSKILPTASVRPYIKALEQGIMTFS